MSADLMDPSPGSITDDQARGIYALCAVLARPVPDLWEMSRRVAGDLILSLRAETRGHQ